MLMQYVELRYRANMMIDPIWEERYRVALDHNLPDPVDLDEVNRLMGGSQGFSAAVKNNALVLPPEIKDAITETWRDRSPLL